MRGTNMREYTIEELGAMPTELLVHSDELKIDEYDHRVWLCFDNEGNPRAVHQVLLAGGWVTAEFTKEGILIRDVL